MWKGKAGNKSVQEVVKLIFQGNSLFVKNAEVRSYIRTVPNERTTDNLDSLQEYK
ncbi:MAG: DUF3892 domain-containing protein [Rhodospirillales bacterium]|nr:DUF3892 domain-containing protein [Rhodospirillales bacterium]